MSEVDRIRSLINGLQLKQPKLYEALSAIAKALENLDETLATVRSEINAIPESGLPIAPNVTIFTYSFTPRNVILRWEQPDTSIFSYEIKIGGTGWDDASSILTSSTLSAVFDPLPVGTTTYWIKGIDFDGNESMEALQLDVIVPPIGNITITAEVIDNNVLFRWTEPVSTFVIDYFNIYRDSILIGRQDGTFTVIFESVGGTFEYSIEPIDIAGNIGPESSISVEVRQPPDFDLLATLDDSTLNGTKVNTIINDSRLLCNVNTVETWQEHFVDNSWAHIQDQIDADYPLYIQPTPLTGSYEKIFDFGAIFDGIIITLIWNQNQISGTTTIDIELSYSDDNVTYSTPVVGRSVFAPSVRYVKAHFDFTGSDDTALMEFYELQVNLNIKVETDSGLIQADKDDVDGTVVEFNKDFRDINSIILTTDSLEPVYAIYDFVDIPNPTEFYVFAYDSAGIRIDYPVSWMARGIT